MTASSRPHTQMRAMPWGFEGRLGIGWPGVLPRTASMPALSRTRIAPRLIASAAVLVIAAALSGCGAGKPQATAATNPSTTTATTALPGAGKPQVTIGDKNFTEQFVLGQ